MKDELIYEKESYVIRGAVYEVYKQIGCGFLESVYQDCLAREFRIQNVPFEPQKTLRLHYRDELIEPVFVADFVCFNKIIVEIKAISKIVPIHEAQVMNYLKMTDMQLGLLVNFGSYPRATVQRIVNSQKV
ncbi:MAG: GxxExxY protein [Planctomycetaceae bacterium]|nr:GxxExxY protein [Planctomycetaceae bacterium]